MTFQPAAGAHGEFTGLLLIKAYHKHRGDQKRTKIIVPDSAHGTNPASATMAGFTVVSIPSREDGCVDLEKLKAAVGDDTAGLMLTNPNTVGLFDKNILEITRIVHDAGGLNYYDGANLNAVMGVSRPGDMGFDVVHLNLHKTFSTPHGGGGPGSGPVGCKSLLAPFLPGPVVKKQQNRYHFEKPEHSIEQVKSFYGNFTVVVKALSYILTLGAEGIREAAQNAVLNANYMMKKLDDLYTIAYQERCMHEFVMSLEPLKKETGISAMDIAKGLLDNGIHPPTMYFPPDCTRGPDGGTHRNRIQRNAGMRRSRCSAVYTKRQKRIHSLCTRRLIIRLFAVWMKSAQREIQSFAIYFNKTKSACLKKFRCAAFVRGAIYYDWQSTILQGNRNQSLR